MRAIGIFLVIEEIKEAPKKTKGGLLLTDRIKEDIRYRKGKVISVGEMVKGVEENDTIYYDKHAGFNIELDEKIYLVIKQPDVVIVL